MKLLRTQAIVLKGMDLGEADRILTMFTREKGKMRIVANGVRRTRSTLAALVQPFTYNNIVIYMGSSIPRLQQGELLDAFLPLREDLLRMAYGSYVLELIDKLLGDEDAQEEVFNLLLITLQLIKEKGPQDVLLRRFELILLSILGYQPHLIDCVRCRKDLTKEDTLFFSVSQGGLECRDCVSDYKSKKVRPETVAAMIVLLESSAYRALELRCSPASWREMETVMEEYILYRTERELKTMSFLRNLRR